MADDLALKVAKVEKELLLSNTVLAAAVAAGTLAIDFQEADARAVATRIVISATMGQAEMEGANNPTGIFNVMVTIALKVKTGTGSTALINAWLREISAANNIPYTGPAVPSAGYAAALAALSVFTIKDDIDTTQEDAEDIRKVERVLNVLAREA